jgi:hypothetical protein
VDENRTAALQFPKRNSFALSAPSNRAPDSIRHIDKLLQIKSIPWSMHRGEVVSEGRLIYSEPNHPSRSRATNNISVRFAHNYGVRWLLMAGRGRRPEIFRLLKRSPFVPFEYLSASLNSRLNNEIKRLSIRVPGQSEVSVRTWLGLHLKCCNCIRKGHQNWRLLQLTARYRYDNPSQDLLYFWLIRPLCPLPGPPGAPDTVRKSEGNAGVPERQPEMQLVDDSSSFSWGGTTRAATH